MPISWAPQVIADSGGLWSGNALRFATKEEALAHATDLMWRWILVKEIRVIESDDPVNCRWDYDRGLTLQTPPDTL